MDIPDPASTEYVVIRPAAAIINNPGMASHFDGQWRRRCDLETQDFIEFDGANGIVRAFPTGLVELSAAGDQAQVYEVLNGTG